MPTAPLRISRSPALVPPTSATEALALDTALLTVLLAAAALPLTLAALEPVAEAAEADPVDEEPPVEELPPLAV